MAEKNEKEKAVNEQIRDFGQVELEHGEDRISMLTIIGEIEGHECLPAATKTTKYEHVLPKLAEVEEKKCGWITAFVKHGRRGCGERACHC